MTHRAPVGSRLGRGPDSSMARAARERARELAFYALDDRYRMSAVEELLDLGKHAAPAVPALAKCLRDVNRFVRTYAAEALGSCGKSKDTIA